MSEVRVASRYAKSLLELAQERGVLENVHDDMQMFRKVVKESRDLELALKNPIIKPDRKKAILKALFTDFSPLTQSFFDIVASKKRTDVLPSVALEFHKQYNIINNIQVARVTTAVALDEKLRSEMITLVKEISGKDKIHLEETVDASIIGGYILKVGDKQVDDSIKSKLGQLRRDLTKNQYVKEF